MPEKLKRPTSPHSEATLKRTFRQTLSQISMNSRSSDHFTLRLLPGLTFGDVAIFLDAGHWYLVNSTALRRCSSWFHDKTSRKDGDLSDGGLMERVIASFVLPKTGGYILARISKAEAIEMVTLSTHPAGEATAIPQHTASSPPVVKQELDYEIKNRPSSVSVPDLLQKRLRIRDAYVMLLCLLHGVTAPQHPEGFKNTLSVVKEVIDLAKVYHCTDVVRPHLSSALHHYRKDLFIHIKNDPPRFVMIAAILKDTSIMTEGLIHMIGCYPAWDWRTKEDRLVKSDGCVGVMDLVRRKAKELSDECLQLDRELFSNTLTYIKNKNAHPITVYDDSQAWMLVQFFRDWFSIALAAYKSECNPKRLGLVYRPMHRGGETYLPSTEIFDKFDILGMGYDRKEVVEDLKLLKDFAKDVVKDICQNNIMLDVEIHGITYLTCANITEDDMPWRDKSVKPSSKIE
jgi:hypothetical protein